MRIKLVGGSAGLEHDVEVPDDRPLDEIYRWYLSDQNHEPADWEEVFVHRRGSEEQGLPIYDFFPDAEA